MQSDHINYSLGVALAAGNLTAIAKYVIDNSEIQKAVF
jgi:hypothetical protein